ncbi:MAG: single-stranded DNA-binding protein [Methylococcaceae bacterium]
MSNVFTATCTVVRDAEVRYLASGAAVLNVTVANNIGFGDKQKTLFIRCALFGKRAEGQLKDYLLKGQQVMVSGELSENEYQANDGTTKKSLELVANIIDLVGGKREGGQPAQQNPRGRYPEQQPKDNFADYDDDIQF